MDDLKNNLDNLKKWEVTHLLDHVDENFTIDTSWMLEGQRLYNETHDNMRFRRISIPLMFRVSQALFERGINVKGSSKPIEKWYILNTEYKPEMSNDGRYTAELNREAELVMQLSESLTNEIAEKFPHGLVLKAFKLGPMTLSKETFSPRNPIMINCEEINE